MSLLLTLACFTTLASSALPPTLQNMQGVDDNSVTASLATSNDLTDLHTRYSNLEAKLLPGLARYNFFWVGLESGPPPSSTPMVCPPTHILVPSNETDRVSRGYNLYHCYDLSQIHLYDTLLAHDASIGAASAFIMYGAPEWAVHENCTGFPWPPNPNFRLGCLPWSSLNAYYDYVLFSVERWRAPWGSGKPRLSAICVWNEVQSLGWSDPSPILPNRQGPQGTPIFTPSQMATYTGMIANLTLLAGKAGRVASPTSPPFIFLSTDHFITPPPTPTGGVGHLGLTEILDGMWPAMWEGGGRDGSVSWGVCVHPYDAGDPRQDLTKQGIYTFATLAASVAAYQCKKVVEVGGLPASQCHSRPETQMWASEQGWPQSKSMNKTLQARNICLAHSLSLAQGVWAVTHNLFQSLVPSSQGGSGDFSLIDEPPIVALTLSNGPGHETFDAYASLHPGVFGKSPSHYCCVRWKVGCPQ